MSVQVDGRKTQFDLDEFNRVLRFEMYNIILQLHIYLHAKDNSISTDGETADPGVKAIILF